jgi:hypothetical protein
MTSFYTALITMRWVVGRAMRSWAALGLLLLIANLVSAQAATYTVNAAIGNDTQPCSTSQPCKTITHVLGLALLTNNDTISIQAGTYTAGETFPLLINKTLTLMGVGNPVIDAGASNGVIEIGSVAVTIDGVTIRNGSVSTNPNNGGGGIFNNGGKLILKNSVVTKNKATGGGGGIYIQGGSLDLDTSIVSDNDGGNGTGGIYNLGGQVILTNSIISNNTGGGVGGLRNTGVTGAPATMTVDKSTVSLNIANANEVGGILNDCAGSGNATMTLINSTVSGNRAVTNVGGIKNWGGPCSATMILISSTVSKNVAGGDGGGIKNIQGTVSLKNTIVADNTASSGANCSGGNINSLGNNLSNDNTCMLPGGEYSNTPSGLLPLGNYGGPTQTHKPTSAPPIGGVPNGFCTDAASQPIATDQRGNPRAVGAACTIGSVEEAVPVLYGSVIIQKDVRPDPREIGQTLSFKITLTCTNPTGVYSVFVSGDSVSMLNSLPVGSKCQVSENLPALPRGCRWLPPQFSPQPVIIGCACVTELVTNGYRCLPL